MQKQRLHPDFSHFPKEAFETVKSFILSIQEKEPPPSQIGDLPGSILSEDCKLYPVLGIPYGSSASDYRSPHLAFSVWVPKSAETKEVPQWEEGESVAEFDDKLRIRQQELKEMDYDTFCKTFASRIEQFLDTQVTHGVLPASFIGEDSGFFRHSETFQKNGETWLIDGREKERQEHPKLTFEEKIYRERQAFNQKIIDEAMPKGANEEEAHAALLAFAKKHDYIIVKNLDASSCECYQIPHAIHIDEACGYDWADELPKGVGSNTDMSLAEGITTIDDMSGLYPGIYIDTEENRRICLEELQNAPSRRMENPQNGGDLSTVAKYYPEHPFSKQLEKEHRKLPAAKRIAKKHHSSWCR